MSEYHEPSVDFEYPYALETEEVSKLAIAISELTDWIFASGKAKKAGVHTRLYVLAWLVKPGYFDHETEARVAKDLGISPVRFCQEISSFRDRFGFFSPLCNSEEARKNKAKGARNRHAP